MQVSEITPHHWMESQREWVSKTQGLWWTWGQWWCPQRAPGHPAQDSEGTPISSRAKEVFAAKEKLQHHPHVLTLKLLCFPLGLLSPSAKKIPRPWKQQVPGMCLHSPEEQKWHHLEHGPLFLILSKSLPSRVLPRTPRSVGPCSAPHRASAAAARQELQQHTQTLPGAGFTAKPTMSWVFTVPRKGLGEVAVDILLNTSLHSQEKVRPSTLAFPWGSHPSMLVPSLPLWAARFILLPGVYSPFHCHFWGKNRTSANVYQF